MSLMCRNLGLSRSSYYYRPAPVASDEPLRQAIRQIVGKRPTYGSRRIFRQLALAPYGLKAGRHRVRHLMTEMNLQGKPKRSRGTTDSKHGLRLFPNLVKGMKATRPNDLWVSDITYIALPSGQAYLAIIMDVFTRNIRGWRLSHSLGQTLTEGALKRALRTHPAPAIHHSDRGGQYAAKAYVQLLHSAGTRISMAGKGKPSENGYAERVIRTIKEEEVFERLRRWKRRGSNSGTSLKWSMRMSGCTARWTTRRR